MKQRQIGRKNSEVDAADLRVLLAQTTTPSSTTDHGGLLGLGDDDHSQYMHITAARTVTAVHTFNPSSAGAAFTLGANATGQLVSGLNADLLDGVELAAIQAEIDSDIAAHTAIPDAHHDPVTVAGLGLSLSAQEITLTSSSNPGTTASILATDASGILTLEELAINNRIQIYNSGTPYLRLEALNTYAKIGNPTDGSHLYLDAGVAQFVNSSGRLNIGTAWDGTKSISIFADTNTRTYAYVTSGSDFTTGMRIQTNVSDLSLMPNSGQVGVNTTAPAYTLDVNGTLNATSVLENDVNIVNWVQSRGMNLVSNGSGLLGDLTNFSQWESFDETELVGGGGSFYESAYQATRITDEYIPVDPAKRYRITGYQKNLSGISGNTYVFAACYDIDKLRIWPHQVLHYSDTETTLAAALNPGDTTIQLTDSANWKDSYSDGDYRHSIAIYGYTNSKGYTYADYTYTRNDIENSSSPAYGAWNNGAINRTTHTITLSPTKFPSGWDGAAYPSGTAVANAYSGGSYVYFGATLYPTTTSWASFVEPGMGYITGTGSGSNNAFWHGTAFVKVGFLLNYTNSGSDTLLNSIWFGEVAPVPATNLSVSSSNADAEDLTHTHAIDTSNNPGAAASILATDASGSLALTGTFAAGATTLSGNLLPAATDTYDIGSSSKLWRKGWLSELESILFVQNSIQVTGGWWMIPHSSGTLAEDVDTSQTTIDFGTALTPGDFIVMRGNLAVEYLEVGTLVSGTTYNVTRDKDGSGANSWPQGQVWANLGQSGDGRIEFDAQTGGPRISVFEQGATYNSQTEIVRIGDLDGMPGYASETYGIYIGDASNHLKFSGSTLTIAGNGAGLTSIDGGNIQTGTVTATQIAANTITASEIAAGTITTTEIAANTITAGNIAAGTITATELNVSSLSAISADMGTLTAGAINMYSGTWDTDATGFRLNATEIAGQNGGTDQFVIATSDGKLTAGGGNVILDEDGISIISPSGYAVKNTIAFTNSDKTILYSRFWSVNNYGYNDTYLDATTTDGRNVNLFLQAIANSPGKSMVELQSGDGGGTNRLQLHSDKAITTYDLRYGGDLISYKNSTEYTVYGFHPLTSPLTSTSWDGDAKTTSDSGTIDLSAVFGAPAGVKAVLAKISCLDNAAGTNVWLGPSSSTKTMETLTQVANQWVAQTGVIPCDSSGDIYISISASITGIHLQIHGYWI